MSESWVGFWWRDLERALQQGQCRELERSPGGARWLAVWGGACLATALGLYLAGGYHAAFVPINGLAAAGPDWAWEWVTVLGDDRLVIAAALWFTRRHPRVFWALCVTAVLGYGFTHSLKPLFLAARPPAVLDPGDLYVIGPGHRKTSFPSGHSLTASAFCGVWLYWRAGWSWRVPLVALAVMVAGSRVVVGVHWPVDVAVGLFGGVLAAWLGVTLSRRWPWGLRPGVHLTLLLPPLLMALHVLSDDGGYHRAAGFQVAVVLIALLKAFLDYLWLPWRRWRRAPDPDSEDCAR